MDEPTCNCGGGHSAFVGDTSLGAGHAVNCPVRIAHPWTRHQLPVGSVVFGLESPQMDADTLQAMLKRRREVIAGHGAALAAAYRQHEEVEEALNNAVAHLQGVADSQELADDLLELEELRDRIWDHLFVGTARDATDEMTMGVR